MGLKLVYEPSIYVIGRQIVADDAVFEFLHEQTNAPNWATDTEVSGQELAEIAGRTCYMSFANPRPGGNGEYLDHILRSGHGSVLEHAVFTFIVAGISRSLSHELVRHRAGWAYSQSSQRYVDEGDVAFVVPPALADEVRMVAPYFDEGGAWQHDRWDDKNGDTLPDARAGLTWFGYNSELLDAYKELSDYLFNKYAHVADKTARRKLAREAARSVLPNCTETKICCTANARALRHFVEMRASEAADAEINRLAIALLKKLREVAPNLFGDYQIVRTPAGREVVATPYRKV